MRKFPETGVLLGFITVFLGFALAVPETFLSSNSISSILTSQAVPGIIAIGITLLMISGEFDLSVGSIMGVSSLVFLYSAVEGIHVLIAALFAITAGAAMGLTNGVLFITTGIPSFIITLGTMLVYRAFSLTAISGGRIVRYADYSSRNPTLDVSAWILIVCATGFCLFVAWIGHSSLRIALRNVRNSLTFRSFLHASVWLSLYFALTSFVVATASTFSSRLFETISVDLFYILNGRILAEWIGGNYRMSILWWLLLTGLFGVLLTNTRYGNAVFATGGNANAARAQGIDIDRVRVTNFTLSGTLAAVAGIIQAARLKSVDPLRGEGMELEVIAAVVIGGTLLKGGYGSVVGSAIGATLTGMLRTGLVLVGIPSNAFHGAMGAIMIAAVIINSVVSRRN